MEDSDGAQEAQQNHTLRSLMKGNILVLTVSRVIWSISGAVVRPYMSLYILARARRLRRDPKNLLYSPC